MKYFLRFCLSTFIFFQPIKMLDACGPSPDTFIPYYNPYIAGVTDYVDRWFDPGSYINDRLGLLDGGMDLQDSFTILVLQDWAAYSNNKFEQSDIESALFGSKMTPSESAFVKWLGKKRGGAQYYELMHECAQFTAGYDEWDDVAWTFSKDDNGLSKELAEISLDKIRALRKLNPDKFISHRLNYLEQRLCFYIGKDKEACDIFTTKFETGEKNWLYYSAKYYYALSQENPKDGMKTLLDLLRESHDKKSRVLNLIFYSIEEYQVFEEGELSANNIHDLLAIKILHDPRMNSLADLKILIKSDPNNPLIPLLLSREINKAEQIYHGTFTNNWYYGFWDDDWDMPGATYSNNAYPEFYKFANKSMAKLNMQKMVKPAYDIIKFAYEIYPKQSYKLMLAYAGVFYDETESSLAKVNEILAKPENEDINYLAKQVQLMALAYQGQWDNPTLQNGIMDILKKQKGDGDNYYNYPSVLLYQSLSHLAVLSAIDGEYTLSYLISYSYAESITDFAPSVKVYDDLISEFNAPRNSFYAYLVNNKGNQKSVEINEVKRKKAQFLMRNAQFDEAVSLYKSITTPTDSTRQLFLVNYEGRNTYLDKYYYVSQPTHKVLDQLLDFANKSKVPGPRQAEYELLVGNALLSMCNSGDNSNLASDMRYYYKPQYPTEKSVANFFSGQMAEPWFRRAFEHCTNPKLGAIITIQWGAASPTITKDDYSWNNYSDPKSSDNPKMSMYQQKFPNSPYLKQYQSDCDYIRLYYSALKRDFNIL
jgi:hypothetical protein